MENCAVLGTASDLGEMGSQVSSDNRLRGLGSQVSSDNRLTC